MDIRCDACLRRTRAETHVQPDLSRMGCLQVFVNKGAAAVLHKTASAEQHTMSVGGLRAGLRFSVTLRPIFAPAHTRRLQIAQAENAITHRRMMAVAGISSSLDVTTPLLERFELHVAPGTVALSYTTNVSTTYRLQLASGDMSNMMGLRFTHFDLECDYDTVIVWAGAPNVGAPHWSGGCRRQQQFELHLPVYTSPSNNVYVTVQLVTDESQHGTGATIHFFGYSSVPLLSTVHGTPESCAGWPEPCGGVQHGICMGDGSCACETGFTGEDCSGYVLCPGPLCNLASVTASRALIAVAPWGNDLVTSSVPLGVRHDVGWIGRPVGAAKGGTVPKPLRSLKRAVELVSSNGTIVVFPGTYTAGSACNITVLGNSRIRIVAMAAATIEASTVLSTTMDCGRSTGFMTALHGANVTVEGVFITNTSGSAVSVRNASASLKSVSVTNCAADRGGGLSVTGRAHVVVDGLVIDGCHAQSGGGVYCKSATVTAATSGSAMTVSNCDATHGGGLFGHSCVFAGSIYGASIAAHNNHAVLGGGVYVSATNSSLTSLVLTSNVASSSGGGLYVQQASQVTLLRTVTSNNAALGDILTAGGGGWFVAQGAEVASAGANTVAGNVAAQGGGLALMNGAALTGGDGQQRPLFGKPTESCGWTEAARLTPSAGVYVIENVECHAGGGMLLRGNTTLSTLTAAHNCAGLLCCAPLVLHTKLAHSRGHGVAGGAGAHVTAGVAIFTAVSLTDNRAQSAGGGLLVSRGAHAILNGGSHLARNTVLGGFGGGAALIQGSRVVSSDGTAFVAANSAVTVAGSVGCGGGVSLRDGSTALGLLISCNNATAGGGVCIASPSLPAGHATDVLNSSLVTNNTARHGGGVLVSPRARAIMRGSVVERNQASTGGGIALALNATFTGSSDTYVRYNVGTHAGGGIFCGACAAVHMVAVAHNSAERGGGLVVVGDTAATVTTDVVDVSANTNLATIGGGGIAIYDSAKVCIRHLTVVGNSARDGGGLWLSDAIVNFPNVVGIAMSVVRANTAYRGGGVYMSAAVLNSQRGGRDLVSLVVNHNVAISEGGGVHVSIGITGSQVARMHLSSNLAGESGGCIAITGTGSVSHASATPPTVSLSHIIANACVARSGGGGLVTLRSHTRLTNVTVDASSTLLGAGGHGFGGGILVNSSSMVCSNVTVARCTAHSGGGVALVASQISAPASRHQTPARAWAANTPPMPRNLIVSGCTARIGGGAAVLAAPTVSALSDISVVSCSAGRGGGVVVLATATANVSNVGIVSCAASAAPDMNNTTKLEGVKVAACL